MERPRNLHQFGELIAKGCLLALLASVCADLAAAAPFNTTVPGDIMSQFRSQKTLWTTNIFGYANALFGILAVIEFAWSAAVMLLEKSDLQSWTAALVRKIMWIGAFYALLINGRFWIPAIIDSFTQMGASAAGVGSPLNPGAVFGQGLAIAGGLMDSGASSAFFTSPGTSLALIFAAILIMLSYIIITLNYVVTFVESYLVISVGFIFLGFGGSRWTVPYTERFLGLAVSIGVKILLLYCLISAGMNLGVGWMTEATSVGTAPYPAMTAFDVMGGAVIFMMSCWQIPKLFSAVLGGAPALTGGDLIATGTAVVAGSVAVGSLATAGVGLAGAPGSAANGAVVGASFSSGSAGSTGVLSGVASVHSAGGGSVPPPPPPLPPNGGPWGGGGSNGPGRRPEPPGTAGSTHANDRGSQSTSDTSHISFSGDSGSNSTENTLSSTGTAPQVSQSREDAMLSIGGEPLSGSGFERQRPAGSFTSQSIAPPFTARGDPPGDSDKSRAAADNREAPGSSSAASDVASVRTASGPLNDTPSSAAQQISAPQAAEITVDKISGKLWKYRASMSMLPSDAAPHATPPRMPIEHSGE